MMSALLVLLLLPTQVPGSISIDPGLNWYTLETDHFDVHFSCHGRPDSSGMELAREVADICEGVYATLTPVVGWAPRARTQIIIADFYDYWNGWAAPFPNNTITVIPTPPAGGKSNEGDWLRTLILHEYSHILQIDRVAGVPEALRKVFGRISMPNALAPAWLDEGYAVYNETRFTDFGRLRSAEYDMIARAAADSGRLLPADRCGSYELQRFPGGGAPYLYGSWLHGHVAAKGDSGIWDRYNRSRSSGFPFFENLHARRTFGRSIYDLWDETQVSLIAAAARASGRVSESPVTQLRQLTHEGFRTGSPLWSRYGTRLYYISETDRECPAIKMIDTATSKTTVLHQGLVTGNLSMSPDGRRLAFTELNLAGNYYEHTDIFALDLAYGGVRQLTHGQRARDPDFASDTSLLVFVSNGRGQNNLNLLDLATGEITALTETEDHTSIHGPRFSPSGKWIAVGVNRPGGYADIELVDRRTGWTIPVTHDRANDLSPAWSRTGKYLFFVSDRTGIFNLYAYQLASGETFQVTNVLYGVFEPSVSLDNRKIALTSFSTSGYDIATIGFRAADWRPAPEFNEGERIEERGMKSSVLHPPSSILQNPSQLYYYNPFPGILPAFWLPWISASRWLELGAFTLGWDALQFHQYQLTGGYRFGRSSPFLSAGYTLRRWRPVISAVADLDLHSQAGSVNAELPFLATRHSNWLDLGVTASHESALTARADLDWTFSDAHQYRFDVAPVEGRVIGLHADAQSRSLLSDRDLTRVLGYWVQYFGNPPQTWSLRSKLALGTAFGDAAATAWELGTEPGLLGARGYREASERTRTVLAAGLQFRTPLWWVERGLGTGPLFLQNFNVAAFADFGLASGRLVPDARTWSDARAGVGAELRADLIVSHLLPAGLYAGCGFGLNPFWSYRFYFGLSSAMLEGLLKSPIATRQSQIPVTFRHLPETR
jgi:Tol biopolymer transport system component